MRQIRQKYDNKVPFRSISRKIMFIMLTTVVLFLVTMLLLNLTILKHSKEEVIFQQLWEASNAKKMHDREKLIRPELQDDIWVAHFFVRYQGLDFETFKDRFAQEKYGDDAITDAIASETYRMRSDDLFGKVVVEDKIYYFYREWSAGNDSALIFFLGQKKQPLMTREMIVFLLAFMGVAAVTSRLIANGIAKQVRNLDAFAEEIAKRNWEAPVPETSRDEIGLLTDSLEMMRDALKVAEERDRKFLQATSHDLKTPVMLIKGYAQAIIDGVNIDGEKSKAGVILSEADKLESRIVQLLRMNTLDQSLSYTDEWEEIRLDRLLKSVIEKFKVISPQLEWVITLEETLIKGNKESLLIAFENLLDNQCRYARRTIWVSLAANEIRIGNDGEPFHTEDIETLFNPLVKDEGGKFGLGLAIVQKVIKGHRWSIGAENLDKGVCFTIQIKKLPEM